MPAGKVNYVVLYEGSSQVYGCASKKVALDTLPPAGFSLDSKRILFVSMEPDTTNLVVRQLPPDETYSEEVLNSLEDKEED